MMKDNGVITIVDVSARITIPSSSNEKAAAVFATSVGRSGGGVEVTTRDAYCARSNDFR